MLRYGKIQEISEIYVASAMGDWTTLKDIKFYYKRDLNSQSSIIKKGTPIKISKTDEKEWVYINNIENSDFSNALGGWIKIKDNVVLSEGNAKIEEVFKRERAVGDPPKD